MSSMPSPAAADASAMQGLAATGAQFTGFVVCGGISAATNLGSRWLLSHALPYAAAITLAYMIGMATAFVLHRTFVFRPECNKVGGQVLRFVLVNGCSFLIVLTVSVLLADTIMPAIGWTWHAKDVAHFIGVGSPVLFSFYAHRLFTFRRFSLGGAGA